MAFVSLLCSKTSLYTSYSLSSFSFCPWHAITSFFFSSRCRLHPFTPPLQVPPPTPKKVPFTVSVHGNTWQDPYHWMSNTEDPNFLEYLNQENSYAEAFMADTNKLQSKLSSEMKRRIPTTVSTPPERWGPWLVNLMPCISCLRNVLRTVFMLKFSELLWFVAQWVVLVF